MRFSEYGRKPMFSRGKRFVLRDIGELALFENRETTFQCPGDFMDTIEEQAVHRAGCGHIVGFSSPSELAAECHVCGKTLCVSCAVLRCTRCLCILCTEDSRLLQGIYYCARCRLIVLAQRMTFGTVRAFHRAMSREL